ncbi:hypothetical protein GSI_00130 [Ganoderma sinense ZZ0214-1]|uniref:Uncharacterized protein n=1 Tax=Ganoderma sinense ZZ0214-1 TaxID=1077348 RepID=A0A2G8SRM9_9APHY|nr:hypothetical protein GSI_00130 [Ganoderma sinense ZZ0214-1]
MWLSRGSVAVQPGPMGKLSTEVLDMVFEVLLDGSDPDPDPNEDFLDCIIFAISCKRLLTIGKRHILHTLISRHARAADCRLVCLGWYAYPPDQAPPGMLTAAELEEIAMTPDPDEHSWGSVEKAIARRCLYHFAGENYAYTHMAYWRLFEPFRKTVDELWHLRRQDPAAMDAFYSALDLRMITKLGGVGSWAPGLEYAEGPRVLCNTSKGEYVREDALVGWDMEYWRVTLAHALLARVCYSPDDSISMCCGEEYKDRLVKGPWAGDRFRIISEDEMPVLKGGKRWRDVTGEVNELLCHLLEGEFPEEYCKTICSPKEGGMKEAAEKENVEEEACQQKDNEKKDGEKGNGAGGAGGEVGEGSEAK